MITTDVWERAWAEFVEAEGTFRSLQAVRFRRGYARACKSAGVRWRKAVERLRKIDPEFCDRNNIGRGWK